ncbi:MAG: sulfite exporter TauE/SafE family protein [Lachnospiraceae bacterium]|nr:sulfite exporter TauE/SafE family protein [Lachnospiraceae bacterium]
MSQIIRTVLFVIIQFFANFVQAVTGFGGGPISMPPSMPLVGVGEAKAAVTCILWLTCIVVSVREIKNIDYKQLGIILACMAPGVLFGMWLFSVLPLHILMLIYGIIVILIGARRLFFPSGKELPKILRFTALILAGLMQGMFTSGGPFLVIYSVSAIPDKTRFRATMSTVWTVINTYMVISMFRKGMYANGAGWLVVYSMVPVALAILLGKKVADRLNHELFLKVIYALLMVSGALLVYNYFNIA